MRVSINRRRTGRKRTARIVAGLLALAIFAAGEARAQAPAPLVTLSAPLDRVIHDTQGRAINARIRAVSALEVEFEDRSRGTRFAVPLERLRRDHREFLSELHAKLAREARLAAKRAAPETAWQKTLRADLLAVPRGEARLRPAAEGWFGDSPFIVMMIREDQPLYVVSVDVFHGSARALEKVEAPVVWLAMSKDAGFSAGKDATLPMNHAVLAHAAWRRAAERAAQVDGVLAGEARGGLLATADERVAERSRRVLEALPAYWPRAPWFEYWSAGLRRLEDSNRATCFLLTREGRPATYRGAAVAGEPGMVAKLLETRVEALARENGVEAAKN